MLYILDHETIKFIIFKSITFVIIGIIAKEITFDQSNTVVNLHKYNIVHNY